jgi:hypothetical protein
MIVERTLRVLVLLVAAAGCTPQDGGTDPDANMTPIIMYDPLTANTWSLSMMGGGAQLSITDATSAAACALAVDQHNGLGAAGGQIILRLPGTVTETCPALTGGYTLRTNCPATLGSEAYVPEGCAFYRRWDAQGVPLGITVALNGVITIAGTAASCTIRANVGFLGAAFSEVASLANGTGVQPWCKSS